MLQVPFRGSTCDRRNERPRKMLSKICVKWRNPKVCLPWLNNYSLAMTISPQDDEVLEFPHMFLKKFKMKLKL